MMIGNFLLLDDGSWWCIMLDDGYWWCIMFEVSSGWHLLSFLTMALWFSIKQWDTWFTLFLTTPNFTPQKNKTSVSVPSNMLGWLDASNQWTTVFSKMIEGRMWTMFLSGAILEWSSSIRTLSCVKGYVCWYLIILSAYDCCNRILGMVLYLHYYSQNVPIQQKTLSLPAEEETCIYIYKFHEPPTSKKPSEQFDTFLGESFILHDKNPDYWSMMPMVWYWSYLLNLAKLQTGNGPLFLFVLRFIVIYRHVITSQIYIPKDEKRNTNKNTWITEDWWQTELCRCKYKWIICNKVY